MAELSVRLVWRASATPTVDASIPKAIKHQPISTGVEKRRDAVLTCACPPAREEGAKNA